MILNQNYEILVSVSIYLIVQFLCKFVKKQSISMHNTHPTLTSIPESYEIEDDVVPKKKHEVLKAKYKCLKKLFQIYDASVIGILPQTNNQHQTDEQKHHRRKRSRRTKTDASAGTTESYSNVSDNENTAATAVIKELKLDNVSKIKDDKSTQDSKEDVSIGTEKDYDLQHPTPYLMINEKRKLTRFQSFLQRILGIRRERFVHDRAYASDDNISNRYEKRRRRGLRLRRRRRAKRTQSEIALRDLRSPVILSYVQTIQKNCLLDTTQRQCPMLGCKMLTYGIINYNDHLNLCHFPDRTYVCLYCHEGFTKDYDKSIHENEHIGISKLNTNLIAVPSTTRFSTKIANNTQTDLEMSTIDVPEDKLKKIVSFFDKITEADQIVAEMKKNRCPESNLQTLHRNHNTDTESNTTKSFCSSGNSDSDKTTTSSMNLQKLGNKITSTIDSDVTSKYPCVPPVRCQLCGEHFDYRRQLSIHLDLEHRTNDKFSKFHSCAGILNHGQTRGRQIQSATQSLTRSLASTDVTDVGRRKSDESLSYEPSTNIVYYTSNESVDRKPSVVNSLVKKVRSGFFYKWEPGTKIIHV